MNARARLFFRFKLYGIFGSIFLLLILGAGAVRWLPALHFQHIVAFDDRGVEIPAAPFFISLFRDPIVRVVGEDSMLLWLASTARLYPLSLPQVEMVIDWRNRSMTIRATPQTRAMIWCTTAQCVWVNNEGLGLEVAPAAEGQLVPRVSEVAETAFTFGDRVLPRSYFDALLHIFRFLYQSGVSVASVTFDRETFDIIVTTSAPVRLLFNIRFDSTIALPAWSAITNAMPRSGVSYIDFRVPQKIYYGTNVPDTPRGQ